FWSYSWPDDSLRVISTWKGIAQKVGDDIHLAYAKGCSITDTSKAGFEEAVETARKADIVIMEVGEAADMSGEAKSRSNIHLPGVQEDLIKAIYATGKPVIVLINAGRPLIFNWTSAHVPAILYTWWLGTEAGGAVADVLFGDYNPSGKLPITFPRAEGQIPIYYDHFNTGRPPKNANDLNYVSSYIDLPNSPAYPFGYGLSYTTFSYSDITLNSPILRPGGTLEASVEVTNTGKYPGKETVQLYTRQMVGSVVRPVEELKGFKQVYLTPGESRKVTFALTVNDLRFYNAHLNEVYEPGDFKIFIGTSSAQVKQADFKLEK
ncbi:MAG: glycoside hydrolase family 3 C-terminal domain-containing protein, partial [Bacteroidota bacterium]|nr:glycoside hydrolase family 3 C-terminal domain-containing protein [Bacteroidota bacterium]